MIGQVGPILFLLKKSALEAAEEGVGPFVAAMRPIVPSYLVLSGVTRDSAGVILPNCVVKLYRTDNDLFVDSVISDANGNFMFTTTGPGEFYYEVAYKVGSPDVAGTTVNTLIGI